MEVKSSFLATLFLDSGTSAEYASQPMIYKRFFYSLHSNYFQSKSIIYSSISTLSKYGLEIFYFLTWYSWNLTMNIFNKCTSNILMFSQQCNRISYLYLYIHTNKAVFLSANWFISMCIILAQCIVHLSKCIGIVLIQTTKCHCSTL